MKTKPKWCAPCSSSTHNATECNPEHRRAAQQRLAQKIKQSEEKFDLSRELGGTALFDLVVQVASKRGINSTGALNQIVRSLVERQKKGRKPTQPKRRKRRAPRTSCPKRDARTATLNGKTQTIEQWAREYHLDLRTVYDRLSKGWSLVRTLSNPYDLPPRGYSSPSPPPPPPPDAPVQNTVTFSPEGLEDASYFKLERKWYVRVQNEVYELGEFCRIMNIDTHKVRNRFNRGVEFKRAITSGSLIDLRNRVEVQFEGDLWNLSLDRLSELSGVAKSTIRERLRKGWPLEEVLDPEAGKRRSRSTPPKRFITFQGRTQGMSEWAREIGVSRITLRERLKRMSVERALTMEFRGERAPQKLTMNGVTRTRQEWAEALGGSIVGLQWRLSNGWSLERTLTTPFQERKKPDDMSRSAQGMQGKGSVQT